MDGYRVYGNYGDASQVELAGPMGEGEAENWIRSYTRWGNYGGYGFLAVVGPDSAPDVCMTDEAPPCEG